MKTNPFAHVLLATTMAVASLSACTVAREQQTVGSYIDDTALTTRIKARFAEDQQVSVMAISVQTLRGVVQLSGFAKSADERVAAERLARGVPGVVQVRNDIVISS